jgi:hypothetical protein
MAMIRRKMGHISLSCALQRQERRLVKSVTNSAERVITTRDKGDSFI